jgi:hypothetical protein
MWVRRSTASPPAGHDLNFAVEKIFGEIAPGTWKEKVLPYGGDLF